MIVIVEKKVGENKMKQSVEMLDSQVETILKHLKSDMEIFEIGCYAGKLTTAMAKRCKRVFAVDPFISNYDKNDDIYGEDMSKIKSIFSKAIKPFNNIIFFNHTSEYVLKYQRGLVKCLEANNQAPEQINGIILDGDHSSKGIAIDKEWIKYIKDGGLIIIHDYCDLFSAIKKFVDEELIGKYLQIDQEQSLIIFKKERI